MSTTNDEQQRPKEREPMLSNQEIERPLKRHPETTVEIRTAKEVRDFYESLITTGKLRVVEEVEMVPDPNGMGLYHCSGCNHEYFVSHGAGEGFLPEPGQFCVCGNKIKR